MSEEIENGKKNHELLIKIWDLVEQLEGMDKQRDKIQDELSTAMTEMKKILRWSLVFIWTMKANATANGSLKVPTSNAPITSSTIPN